MDWKLVPLREDFPPRYCPQKTYNGVFTLLRLALYVVSLWFVSSDVLNDLTLRDGIDLDSIF